MFRVEGGELFDRVVSVGKFSERIAKLLFYQMLVAVKVCVYLLYFCLLCSVCQSLDSIFTIEVSLIVTSRLVAESMTALCK